jgi:Lon protease-like protein
MKIILPNQIPVFPLNGVIYFPETNLPLNIFEQRYLDLINDVMKKNKYLGMIQTKEKQNEVHNIGCLGKISDYTKIADGRILVNLTGVSRFEIQNEIPNDKKYREFEVSYKRFPNDILVQEASSISTNKFYFFLKKIKKFFIKNGLLLNWKEFENLQQLQQINTLAMIAPISNEEKQKLLEAIKIEDKIDLLIEIIEFYSYEINSSQDTIQ